MRSRLAAVACAIATLAAACGPAGPPAPATPDSAGTAGTLPTLAPPPIDVTGAPANVHVETDKATATWIGPAGGKLTATSADGTGYALDIPEYAVKDPTAIIMTPVTSVDALGLSGGLAGAVFLQPAGLALAVPATLTITTSKAAPAGTRLVGFDVPDGGGPIDLIPAAGEGTVSVAIFHFSAPGAAYGTTQDLAQVGAGANSTRMAGAMSSLLAYPVPWDDVTKGITGLLIDTLWSQAMRPALVDAAGDLALLRALKDWRSFIFLLNLWAHDGDASAALADGINYDGGVRSSHTVAYQSGQIQIGVQVFGAIEGNKALCNESHDLNALANMWFWAGIGERYAPGERDWQVEARGCAQIAVGVANLPTNLQTGGSDSFTINFVIEFEDETGVPADVQAAFQGSGFTFASSGGATMTAGVAAGSTLTAGVVATQAPPYTLTASACWYLGGLARNLCSDSFSLPFGAGATPSPGPQASGSTSLDISGTYALKVTCDSVEWGTGTAIVSQTGSQVSVTWSVTIVDAGVPGDCRTRSTSGQWPTHGTHGGSLVEQLGQVDVQLSNWTQAPCVNDSRPPTSFGYARATQSIGIPLGSCTPSGLNGRFFIGGTLVGP